MTPLDMTVVLLFQPGSFNGLVFIFCVLNGNAHDPLNCALLSNLSLFRFTCRESDNLQVYITYQGNTRLLIFPVPFHLNASLIPRWLVLMFLHLWLKIKSNNQFEL